MFSQLIFIPVIIAGNTYFGFQRRFALLLNCYDIIEIRVKENTLFRYEKTFCYRCKSFLAFAEALLRE